MGAVLESGGDLAIQGELDGPLGGRGARCGLAAYEQFQKYDRMLRGDVAKNAQEAVRFSLSSEVGDCRAT